MTPVYKGGKDKHVSKNSTPDSILNTFSEVMERQYLIYFQNMLINSCKFL